MTEPLGALLFQCLETIILLAGKEILNIAVNLLKPGNAGYLLQYPSTNIVFHE